MHLPFTGRLSDAWHIKSVAQLYQMWRGLRQLLNEVSPCKILEKSNAADSPEWVYVAFPKGAYNRWHSHKTGQILIATDGVGLHQIKGGKLEVLQPGDVVFCPPGVVHWHGAAPESSFAHIAINSEDNHEVTWYDFPADEYPAS